MELSVGLTSSHEQEQEWRSRLQGDNWKVEKALEALQEAPNVSQSTKLCLFTEVLERELKIFSGELNIRRDNRFYTIGHCLTGIAKLDEVPIDTRFGLLQTVLENEALSQLRWHAIEALGHLAGFRDSADRRRKDILFSVARGSESWYRVYAIQAMHSLDIPLDALIE